MAAAPESISTRASDPKHKRCGARQSGGINFADALRENKHSRLFCVHQHLVKTNKLVNSRCCRGAKKQDYQRPSTKEAAQEICHPEAERPRYRHHPIEKTSCLSCSTRQPNIRVDDAEAVLSPRRRRELLDHRRATPAFSSPCTRAWRRSANQQPPQKTYRAPGAELGRQNAAQPQAGTELDHAFTHEPVPAPGRTVPRRARSKQQKMIVRERRTAT